MAENSKNISLPGDDDFIPVTIRGMRGVVSDAGLSKLQPIVKPLNPIAADKPVAPVVAIKVSELSTPITPGITTESLAE